MLALSVNTADMEFAGTFIVRRWEIDNFFQKLGFKIIIMKSHTLMFAAWLGYHRSLMIQKFGILY